MKLDRLPYDPAALLNFYEEGLGALGALCERTWYDRLEIVAERRAASLWTSDDSIHAVELQFAEPELKKARDADREVFPGCPLTFRLAEALLGKPSEFALERFVLASDSAKSPPDAASAEKRWRAQFPTTGPWQVLSPFKRVFHFSLLSLIRCEIQAVDQHWSLHRIAIGLPFGEIDESLAQGFDFAQASTASAEPIPWPKTELKTWSPLLHQALSSALGSDLESVRSRQKANLQRELDRIDEYFESYARELSGRAERSSNETTKTKSSDRLAAAKAEHARRRLDQISRHQIHVHPRLDALLLIAEEAWQAKVETRLERSSKVSDALFLPRSRRWVLENPPASGSTSSLPKADKPGS
jgi:hypothetical protein